MLNENEKTLILPLLEVLYSLSNYLHIGVHPRYYKEYINKEK